jgi:hypothetical protein
MASKETHELKGRYDTSSGEGNPEAGMINVAPIDPNAVAFGDTKDDLADMARLGKKQEFDVRTRPVSSTF